MKINKKIYELKKYESKATDVHAMMEQEGVVAQLRSFLSSSVDVGYWSGL